jgi:hypothetical protein
VDRKVAYRRRRSRRRREKELVDLALDRACERIGSASGSVANDLGRICPGALELAVCDRGPGAIKRARRVRPSLGPSGCCPAASA